MAGYFDVQINYSVNDGFVVLARLLDKETMQQQTVALSNRKSWLSLLAGFRISKLMVFLNRKWSFQWFSCVVCINHIFYSSENS